MSGFGDRKLFPSDRERFYFQPHDGGGALDSGEINGNGSLRSSGEIPQPQGQEWSAREDNSRDTDDDDDDDDEGDDGHDDDDDEDDGDDDGDDGHGERHESSSAEISVPKNDCGNNGSSEGFQKEGLDRDIGNLGRSHSALGSNRGGLVNDPIVQSSNNIRGSSSQHLHFRFGRRYDNAITVAEHDGYFSRTSHGLGSSLSQGDNGSCGFSGRKDLALSNDSNDTLRRIFSDPVTGILMDDAMILSCGHSFGSGGIQHVLRAQACYTCGQPISADSMAPNLALRIAVRAFRREEELQSSKIFKRRRERFEQEKSSYGEPLPMDYSRGKGVQFPFAVSDRVIIKGNKRTPQRFVGREAIVTTQCLNGWYVVKTLDNAESVKLQYRSLAKVGEHRPPTEKSNKAISPNWL
ncbi:hypothetical protein AMTRI_Chr08g209660 [Amborella trichopoda]|uniref:PUB 62/63 C-terminal domain-containing protein n=1 Tax=Amborella trichopoda TaxID=13333 RepID=W1P2V6_AMBTC|nr:U-box domain-containing protein 62 [Amborella trichopoda]XP_020521825.1 U-box domain-containing protein 62 [Amborella trichopoda]ERN04162.1 hypothetical protein AMTR_s00077p00085930 [Amborella trichopoda]|eukprot:XP_011622659.1 U-box domain-containing protein 62 [Amborella trichopoda]